VKGGQNRDVASFVKQNARENDVTSCFLIASRTYKALKANMNLKSWIRFLRLPAVLTVPGDVLLGAALVGQTASLRSIFAVCAAYLFGMGLNDVVDFPADQIHRPQRPLPRGEISRASGIAACGILAALALAALPHGAMAGLLFLIVLYTFIKNVQLVLGAFLMAACRAMALWIGAGSPLRLQGSQGMVPGLWMLMILQITLLADLEHKARVSIQPRIKLLTLCWLAAPLMALAVGQPHFAIFLPWALLTALALQNFRQISHQEVMHPRNTGIWLSMLIPLQAIFVMAYGQLMTGFVILALWPCLQWSLRIASNSNIQRPTSNI
jgi:hypothetical protein